MRFRSHIPRGLQRTIECADLDGIQGLLLRELGAKGEGRLDRRLSRGQERSQEHTQRSFLLGEELEKADVPIISVGIGHIYCFPNTIYTRHIHLPKTLRIPSGASNRTFDGKKGSLYEDLMQAVAEAKRISKPEFCGFFWKQGAADGTKKDLAEEYFDTFRQLVADLRTDLGVPDLPVFVPSYTSDQELLKSVLSNMRDGDVLKAKQAASKPPGSDKELLEVLLSYLENNGSLRAFGKRPYIAHVIMAQNRVGRDIPSVTTLYPGIACLIAPVANESLATSCSRHSVSGGGIHGLKRRDARYTHR